MNGEVAIRSFMTFISAENPSSDCCDQSISKFLHAIADFFRLKPVPRNKERVGTSPKRNPAFI